VTEATFRSLLTMASALPRGDYRRGYERGVRRAYHGVRFGTEEEHHAWRSFDGHRAELARGYRDGLAGRAPAEEVDEVDEVDEAAAVPAISPEILRAIIEASGLSQVEWARTVVGRDPRTVRRWLAGEAIPPTTVEWLVHLLAVEVTAQDVVIRVAR
jgi:DNA-binding transcriptional regulator YiaG